MDHSTEPLAAAIAKADHVAALTGAGVSTASGIPSFRGEDGIWKTEFDPADFHYSRFQADPGGFWEERLELSERMFPDDVAPNAAHEALAELEEAGHLDALRECVPRLRTEQLPHRAVNPVAVTQRTEAHTPHIGSHTLKSSGPGRSAVPF